MGLRRRIKGDDGGGPSWPYEGEELLETHPDLVDFLSATSWGDGTPRETGTLGVSVDGGNLRARLCDRDAGQVCFLTAESWGRLLQLCEEACGGRGGDWREDRFGGPKGKPKGRG